MAVVCAVLGCGSRSSLPIFDDALDSSDSGPDTGGHTGLDLLGGTGGTAAAPSTGGAPGGAPSGGAPGTGGAPSPCSIDNGGCDPLTSCGVVDNFLMCGPCPPGYGGTGADGCTHSTGLELTYFKPHAPGEADYFGSAVALSADGLTLAVGAPGEEGSSRGVNGDPTSLGSPSSGAVTIYRRISDEWVMTDYIKAENADPDDSFGIAVALSSDGSELVVGAPGEDGFAPGVNGNQDDNSVENSGAAYLFRYSGGAWVQEAYLKAMSPSDFDHFGSSVAISGLIAVGAPDEQSLSTDVDTNDPGDSAFGVGAVYTFELSGNYWNQAYVKAPNAAAGANFGASVALSAPGSVLCVGAPGESSGATGVNGDQNDDSAGASGAVYVFAGEGGWTPHAYVKASNTDSGDQFGMTVSLSAAGDTLAVGAIGEGSLASGINGDQSGNNGGNVGAAYVYSLDHSSWTQIAYVKASNPQSANFGRALALSGDGDTLIVGAPLEQGLATGVDGNQNPYIVGAGAAYLFQNELDGWTQHAYLKASNTDIGDAFGSSLSIDFDGRTMAIGAVNESSGGSGVNGSQSDNNVTWSGAAYVYSSE